MLSSYWVMYFNWKWRVKRKLGLMLKSFFLFVILPALLLGRSHQWVLSGLDPPKNGQFSSGFYPSNTEDRAEIIVSFHSPELPGFHEGLCRPGFHEVPVYSNGKMDISQIKLMHFFSIKSIHDSLSSAHLRSGNDYVLGLLGCIG